MFTGIVEALGEVIKVEATHSNVNFTISCLFVSELQIDQSVAHNGVCLTVVSLTDQEYTVTAIKETLDKSNLSDLAKGDLVNLERCMVMNGRLDGHIVQGHVDQVGECVNIQDQDGSWIFSFKYEPARKDYVTVEKGSITINGTSLTVFNSTEDSFSVAIIPYTFENTVFKNIKVGTRVNLEFDIIGKYVAKLHGLTS